MASDESATAEDLRVEGRLEMLPEEHPSTHRMPELDPRSTLPSAVAERDAVVESQERSNPEGDVVKVELSQKEALRMAILELKHVAGTMQQYVSRLDEQIRSLEEKVDRL